MTSLLPGHRTWKGGRNDDGDREYFVEHLVRSSYTDGPANVMQCPGLPEAMDEWQFADDVDVWAFCTLYMDVSIHEEKEGEAARTWKVKQKFTTKNQDKWCKDQQIEDPLLQPPKVSGAFSDYQEEATHDRFGKPILSSSHEMMRGPQVEFDASRGSVNVEQNLSSPFLAYVLPYFLKDCLNAFPLWGFNSRCIKMKPKGWERKFYGACYVYYTRTLNFEIRPEGFDRSLLDEGSKVLNGHWNPTNGAWQLDNIDGSAPDPSNPSHFIRFKDRRGENCRVILNGAGLPSEVVTVGAATPSNDPYYVCVLNNSGQSLTNTTYWLPQTGGDQDWDGLQTYAVGNVVVDANNYFIANAANKSSKPQTLAGGPWTFLPNWINDKGMWNQFNTYSVGDRVTKFVFQPGTNAAGAQSGTVYVEKYNEADLLTLGIPTIF